MKCSTLLAVALLVSACAADDALDAFDDEPEAQTSAELASPASCAGANSEGRACDDGLFCTIDDRCHGGVCVGEERPCSAVVGFCDVATCDEARDLCVPSQREPGCVDRCDQPRTRQAYQKGWRHGFEAVSKAWDRRRQNCDRTEAFAERILRRIEKAQRLADPDASVKPRRRCRKAGVADGAFAALEIIQDHCDQTCFLDGDLVGQVAATSYCEMAIGADGPLDVAEWLRGPLNMCGLNYEVACDASFIGGSVSYANELGQCEPLTTGAYAQSFDRSRTKSCDYQNHPAP